MLRALATGLLALTAISAPAAAPQGGLDAFAASAPACAPGTKPTPALAPDGTFKAGAPRRTALTEPSTAGTPLAISGTVAGLRCGRIAGATVDLWQPNARGAYDMTGYAFRAEQITDKNGAFAFSTIVPAAPPKRARHLSLRVHIAGRPDLWTEIFFPNDPANARDPRFKPELLLQPKFTSKGEAGTFDVWVDM